MGMEADTLCMDTLWLAVFNKNTIDVNKLDAALAFQIHGFNFTFYLTRLTFKGIYTFLEITHLRFPQSLEDLPSLLTLVNIKKLLGINDAFWRHFKKSETLDVVEARYKPTLVTLDIVIGTNQDAARSCVLRFGH
ncbi:hypothetical protein DFQ29_008947 [Apophysomyces sp. BC1021]|nr:hypothetical protein DFQ29_008947 [Apophysomyces sp. BC1021]